MESQPKRMFTGSALVLAGLAGTLYASFQSAFSVLLVLGAFVALVLARAPQRP